MISRSTQPAEDGGAVGAKIVVHGPLNQVSEIEQLLTKEELARGSDLPAMPGPWETSR